MFGANGLQMARNWPQIKLVMHFESIRDMTHNFVELFFIFAEQGLNRLTSIDNRL